MGKIRSLLLAVLIVAAPGAAGAGVNNLRGNSLELAWTEQRQVVGGRGMERSVSLQVHLQVYLSTQGRFFTKFNASNGMGGLRNLAAFSGQSGMAAWEWHLTGNQLIGAGKMGRGARRVIVAFGGNGSCSVSATAAKLVGESDIKARSMMSGRPVHILSMQAVDLKCAIRPGNIFAQ